MLQNLTAGQRAVAAARAWKVAETEERVARLGEIGRNRSPQKGGLIKNPREHFGRIFGTGKNQVEQAKALIDNDAVGVAAIMNGTSLAEAFRDYERLNGQQRPQVCRWVAATGGRNGQQSVHPIL